MSIQVRKMTYIDKVKKDIDDVLKFSKNLNETEYKAMLKSFETEEEHKKNKKQNEKNIKTTNKIWGQNCKKYAENVITTYREREKDLSKKIKIKERKIQDMKNRRVLERENFMATRKTQFIDSNAKVTKKINEYALRIEEDRLDLDRHNTEYSNRIPDKQKKAMTKKYEDFFNMTHSSQINHKVKLQKLKEDSENKHADLETRRLDKFQNWVSLFIYLFFIHIVLLQSRQKKTRKN